MNLQELKESLPEIAVPDSDDKQALQRVETDLREGDLPPIEIVKDDLLQD